MIKQEVKYFLTALLFYSRIPVPKIRDHSEVDMNRCTRYFPLVGILVGGIVACVFWLGQFLFSNSIAILLSMIAGIFVTGAFHEDGFADACDGFGGGWTLEDRLRIMKDSRIGTYGTIGILFMLLLKFFLLLELSTANLPVILIAAHSVSRLMPAFVILTGRYARNDATSKVKPIGKSMTSGEFMLALLFAIIPLVLFKNFAIVLVLFLPFLSTFWLKKYFEKRIDGYTGDCLGAIQQVSEIGVYISLILLTKYHIWNF